MADPRMRDAGMPLDQRIDEALRRISSGHAAMRVPAEATDHDIVLADCKARIAELERGIRMQAEINDDHAKIIEDLEGANGRLAERLADLDAELLRQLSGWAKSESHDLIVQLLAECRTS